MAVIALSGRALLAIAALVHHLDGCRRSAAPHRVVQCLYRPARGRARRPVADRRPLALRGRSRDLDGCRQGARVPPGQLAGGIDHSAQSRSRTGRLLLGTLADAADAAGAGVQCRRDRCRCRSRRRVRANPQGRRAARTSTARRSADRRDRSRAAAAGAGARGLRQRRRSSSAMAATRSVPRASPLPDEGGRARCRRPARPRATAASCRSKN